MPFPLLAYAESAANPNALLLLILESLGLVAALAVAALIPLMLARSRRHRTVDLILGACLLWALAAIGDALFFLFARYHWSREYDTLVASGYYDPANTAAAPQPQWLIWSILAIAYIALLIYTAKRPAPSTPAP